MDLVSIALAVPGVLVLGIVLWRVRRKPTKRVPDLYPHW